MYEQYSQSYGKLIRVDEDVRDAIEAIRLPGQSINDVLRQRFGLDPKKRRHRAYSVEVRDVRKEDNELRPERSGLTDLPLAYTGGEQDDPTKG